MGDIEKMFHLFRVTPCDCDNLHFQWFKNGDLKSETAMLKMKVHLFGAKSSPGYANFGLKKTC
jgi:hypothetical protein